ncbi:MAG: 23S rRNA (cytidine2498-2'-O)-methyltransferase [Pseudohongiellaceae bacterium]|jgi:23S rRNA (cytidine2498-2'-O)-methyltransferase
MNPGGSQRPLRYGCAMPQNTHAAPPAGTPYDGCAYLAAEGYLDELLIELGAAGEIDAVHDRLVLAPGPRRLSAWAANVWLNPVELKIESIGHGARCLRYWQRNWTLYSTHCHRRAALIADKLPHVSARALVFPAQPPRAPLGAFTLLDEHTMLASPQCSTPVPHGAFAFEEDRVGPPSRAYLKLWEAFTRLGVAPGPDDRCLDLGSCPGGWTWVLAELGAAVVAVDRSPLDERLAARPGIEQRIGSAFSLTPDDIGPVDWLVCDVICYPEKLLPMVQRWLDSGICPRFVCTLKFQAETDHETARAFAALPGSWLTHLACNKHELTWMHVPGVTDTGPCDQI